MTTDTYFLIVIGSAILLFLVIWAAIEASGVKKEQRKTNEILRQIRDK